MLAFLPLLDDAATDGVAKQLRPAGKLFEVPADRRCSRKLPQASDATLRRYAVPLCPLECMCLIQHVSEGDNSLLEPLDDKWCDSQLRHAFDRRK